MLGLPQTTEINQQLAKKTIFTKFQLNNAARQKIDADIAKITLVNEVSAAKINLAAGNSINAFFVAQVQLKKIDFNETSLVLLSKLIPQNILFILQYAEQAKLAVFQHKLIQSDWQTKEELHIELKGLNLDNVWQNIIQQIGKFDIEQGNSLEQQIIIADKRQKLILNIAHLEKQARKELQPKKAFELVQKINQLKQELKDF
ncbi:DUF4391 domain-containing protein [Snodgrassella sp. ESL0253]|uniref:DUF4391 domain-containing protein n=1 Tax=Snodgrassella sp. ESL0253 TaxID=2705031 RepID=UPI0015843AAD|nr:DUF4391 domain-containing protein [Snodgrassella sp. ESL0253]NUE66101.1 DUF4391 domain-containing protein [Snodgrassella sp. ESL0253]